MTMIQSALAYAAQGWPVFPCRERDETEAEYQTRLERMPEEKRHEVMPWRTKQPRVAGGLKAATTDEKQIIEWWDRWPCAAIGLPCGPDLGAFVIDLDVPDEPGKPDGRSTLAALEENFGALPPTVEAKTPSGGRHLFFAWTPGREIRNSSGNRLGPGLDVRGTGGYVVAAPSVTEKGAYVWTTEKGTPLAVAPDWLLDLVAPLPLAKAAKPPISLKATPRQTGTSPYARKALEDEAAEVSGTAEGGRNHALNAASYSVGQLVAGGELDRGEAAAVMLAAAIRAGLPEMEARKTISSGMAGGEKQPRSAPERLMTQPGSAQPGQPPQHMPFAFRHMDDMLAEPTPVDWLIREYLEANTLSQLFGESGSMKSFVAIDMALCIATGLSWHGHQVNNPSAVFYLAGEGQRGLDARVQAWASHHGQRGPFFSSVHPPQFLNQESAEAVAASVASMAVHYGPPRLVVVDTLNRCFGPGDENSTADMTAFVAAMDCLRVRFGCTVLIVHHSGLHEKERSRGSSVLRAALDFEYRLAVKDYTRVLTCTKCKDHEAPAEIVFEYDVVPTGYHDHEKGEALTSCVMRKSDQQAPAKVGRAKLSGSKRIAMESLTHLHAQDNAPVHIEDWREAAYDSGISASDKPDGKRMAFTRAVSFLLDKGCVECREDYYWPVGSSEQIRTGPNIVRTCSMAKSEQNRTSPYKGCSDVRRVVPMDLNLAGEGQ